MLSNENFSLADSWKLERQMSGRFAAQSDTGNRKFERSGKFGDFGKSSESGEFREPRRFGKAQRIWKSLRKSRFVESDSARLIINQLNSLPSFESPVKRKISLKIRTSVTISNHSIRESRRRIACLANFQKCAFQSVRWLENFTRLWGSVQGASWKLLITPLIRES